MANEDDLTEIERLDQQEREAYEEIRLGEGARQVLENPALMAIVRELETEAHEAWATSEDTEEQIFQWHAQNAAVRFRHKLITRVAGAEAAQVVLAQIEKERAIYEHSVDVALRERRA